MKTLAIRPPGNLVIKLTVLCSALLFTLVISEIILRNILFSDEDTGHLIWPPGMRKVFVPAPGVMPGVSGRADFSVNSWGIRGLDIESSHEYRILALGGSTTECLYLDQTEAWPRLLQEALNNITEGPRAWVGNAGMSGMTTRNHVIAMKYLPLNDYAIDAVIVLPGANDFCERLSRGEDYDPYFMQRPEAAGELMAQTFWGGRIKTGPFYKRTALWLLLRNVALRLQKDYVNDAAGKSYIAWRHNRQQSSKILNDLPDLSAALEEYSRNIGMIMDVAAAKSLRLIFATQPYLWRNDLDDRLMSLLWLGGVGDFQREIGRPYYSVEALAEGMSLYNETLKRVCQVRNVECVDLVAILEQDTTVFYDDVHFNESGSRKVAEVLFDHLAQRQPFARVAAVE